jgi:hypothetical protein
MSTHARRASSSLQEHRLDATIGRDPYLDARTGQSASTIPGILSCHDARRFWVLASFSLRSGAHVDTYAPLRCSRKPRQNRKLAGRAFLKAVASR